MNGESLQEALIMRSLADQYVGQAVAPRILYARPFASEVSCLAT